MNFLKKIWQNKIIVFLLFVLLVVVLFKSFLTKPQQPPLILKTPKPTAFPSPTFWPQPTPTLRPTVLPLSQEVLEKIIAQLPFKSKSFEIEYYERTKKFAVTITSGPLEDTMKQAEDWFKSQGVQDPAQIEILWLPTREVLNEIEIQRPIPEP